MIHRGLGRAYAKGVQEACARAGAEFLSFNIFHEEERSPSLMGAFARYHAVDAVVLSGSEKNTSDVDDPWLKQYYRGFRDLIDLRESVDDWNGPDIPILGICFGHQAIAAALGGETSRFQNRTGVETMKLLAQGKQHKYFSKCVTSGQGTIRLGVTHSDHIVRLAPGFHATLTSEYCTVQAAAHDRFPIVSFQGHPELSLAIRDVRHETKAWRQLSDQDLEMHHGSLCLEQFLDWSLTR